MCPRSPGFSCMKFLGVLWSLSTRERSVNWRRSRLQCAGLTGMKQRRKKPHEKGLAMHLHEPLPLDSNQYFPPAEPPVVASRDSFPLAPRRDRSPPTDRATCTATGDARRVL